MNIRTIAIFVAVILLVLLAPDHLHAQTSGPGYNPIRAQNAYVFIDGSNLFHKLREAGVQMLNLYDVVKTAVAPRELVRAYMYTIEERFEQAQAFHGQDFSKNIRLISGISISTPKGVREKAVDALLVADLIYHAAQKNCDYALVLAYDQDYIRALSRVEDFGCRTGVLSLCEEAPVRLQEACDKYHFMGTEYLIQNRWAVLKKTT